MFVRDVIDVVGTLAVLAVDAPDLHVERICHFLEFVHLGAQVREFDVH